MTENDGMDNSSDELTINVLGKWMADNAVSRSDLAKALGIRRSGVDNWFTAKRKSIPKHFQPFIKHLMISDVSSPVELKSQLVIPLNSRILNLAMTQAVSEGLKVEDWISKTIEEAVENKK